MDLVRRAAPLGGALLLSWASLFVLGAERASAAMTTPVQLYNRAFAALGRAPHFQAAIVWHTASSPHYHGFPVHVQYVRFAKARRLEVITTSPSRQLVVQDSGTGCDREPPLWVCTHRPWRDVGRLVAGTLMPGLERRKLSAVRRGRLVVLRIDGIGRSLRLSATLTVDPRTGLPMQLQSAIRTNAGTTVTHAAFIYRTHFPISLPTGRHVPCPAGAPAAAWCLLGH